MESICFNLISERHDEKAEEHKAFVLKVLGPAPMKRKYKEIRWIKLIDDTSSIIVFYRLSDDQAEESYEITYCNDYCDDGGKCTVSNKGEINVKTGELTIYNVTIDDEGYYYYTFWVDENTRMTGDEHEQHLEVFGQFCSIISMQNTHNCLIKLDKYD